MTDGKSFGQYLRGEWEKLRAMNFAEKRQYIWEYYKIQLILLAVGLFVLFQIIGLFINPPPRDYLYIVWIGVPAAHEQLGDLERELLPLAANPDRYRVTVSNYTATDDAFMNNALQQRFMAMAQVGGIDAIISTREGMEEMARIGWIRTHDDGSAQKISLEGSPIFAQVQIDSSDAYISIMANMADNDRLERLINLLTAGDLTGVNP
jgi:hypothetical protein